MKFNKFPSLAVLLFWGVYFWVLCAALIVLVLGALKLSPFILSIILMVSVGVLVTALLGSLIYCVCQCQKFSNHPMKTEELMEADEVPLMLNEMPDAPYSDHLQPSPSAPLDPQRITSAFPPTGRLEAADKNLNERLAEKVAENDIILPLQLYFTTFYAEFLVRMNEIANSQTIVKRLAFDRLKNDYDRFRTHENFADYWQAEKGNQLALSAERKYPEKYQEFTRQYDELKDFFNQLTVSLTDNPYRRQLNAHLSTHDETLKSEGRRMDTLSAFLKTGIELYENLLRHEMQFGETYDALKEKFIAIIREESYELCRMDYCLSKGYQVIFVSQLPTQENLIVGEIYAKKQHQQCTYRVISPDYHVFEGVLDVSENLLPQDLETCLLQETSNRRHTDHRKQRSQVRTHLFGMLDKVRQQTLIEDNVDLTRAIDLETQLKGVISTQTFSLRALQEEIMAIEVLWDKIQAAEHKKSTYHENCTLLTLLETLEVIDDFFNDHPDVIEPIYLDKLKAYLLTLAKKEKVAAQILSDYIHPSDTLAKIKSYRVYKNEKWEKQRLEFLTSLLNDLQTQMDLNVNQAIIVLPETMQPRWTLDQQRMGDVQNFLHFTNQMCVSIKQHLQNRNSVGFKATLDQASIKIRGYYKQLSLKYHPDKNQARGSGDTTPIFQIIREIYSQTQSYLEKMEKENQAFIASNDLLREIDAFFQMWDEEMTELKRQLAGLDKSIEVLRDGFTSYYEKTEQMQEKIQLDQEKIQLDQEKIQLDQEKIQLDQEKIQEEFTVLTDELDELGRDITMVKKQIFEIRQGNSIDKSTTNGNAFDRSMVVYSQTITPINTFFNQSICSHSADTVDTVDSISQLNLN